MRASIEVNVGDCILASYGSDKAYPFYVIGTCDSGIVVGSPKWCNDAYITIEKTRVLHNFGPGQSNFIRTFMYDISDTVSPYSPKSWKLL